MTSTGTSLTSTATVYMFLVTRFTFGADMFVSTPPQDVKINSSNTITQNITMPVSPEYNRSITDGMSSSAAGIVSMTYPTSSAPEIQSNVSSGYSPAVELSWKISSPVILTAGTIGNVLAFLVLRRISCDVSSFNLIFTALSVSDLGLLYSGLFPHWMFIQFGIPSLKRGEAFCKALPWVYNSLGMLSAWLLVAVTVCRALSVMWPHSTRATWTRKQAYAIITVLVIVCFALTSHLLYGVTFSSELKKCLLKNDYFTHFMPVWIWAELLLASVLPFCVIVLGNALLIWTVVKSLRTARHRLSSGQGRQMAAREEQFFSMTLTLIALSTSFVVLTAPICITSILRVNGDEWVRDRTELAHAISNQLWYANSSINFFLYVLTGSRFRTEVKQLLCCTRFENGCN